ncbi:MULTISPECIES: hypothetical protein [Bacillaceae]|uniref:hypothetical protein n=1 Tax=Bacillaceae TaxID=186817 RepID=UPI00036F28B0|nr:MULTISPECIES: hypothetical protein [Bacillaceae]
MYFVIVPGGFCAYNIESFEMLDEAKDRVKELIEVGHRIARLAQKIPMKIKVAVEF